MENLKIMGKISEIHKKVKNKKKKEIYSIFDRSEIDKCFPDTPLNEVFCKKWGKYSTNSYQFSKYNDYKEYKALEKKTKYYRDKIRKSICKVFDINPKDEEFENKFNWAVDGEGDELSKITAVTSSSLCALLCFYNISKERPLYLDIDKKKTKFTASIFEWENPVFKMPSSIDVVLIGHQEGKGGKKVIYFVESKFSEYYDTSKCYPSKQYLEDRIGKLIYQNFVFKKVIKMNIDRDKGSKQDSGTFTIGGDKQYANGVKQMISHYIGVNNFLEGKREHNFGKFLGFIDNANIYLGTIAYKIGDGDNTPFEKYQDLYNNVTKALNYDLGHNKRDKKFKKVLPMISYQGIFKHGPYSKENAKVLANNKIKTFYNL